MPELNLFGHPGRIIVDPCTHLRLIKPQVSGVMGDSFFTPSRGELEVRTQWLVGDIQGIGMISARKWCDKHKPTLEVTYVKEHKAVVFTWPDIIEIQGEFDYERESDGEKDTQGC